MYNPIYGIIPFMVLFHLWYFPPYFFCKVNANERNGKEILSFYLLRPIISIIFISIFQPSLYLPSCHLHIYLPSLSEVVFTTSLHPHQEPSAIFAPFSYIKNGAASRLNTPRCLILYKSNPMIKIILYISLPRIKIILYISLPRIKIILYPRAKNRHHSIYYLGTKVSQVWSS